VEIPNVDCSRGYKSVEIPNVDYLKDKKVKKYQMYIVLED
jgi:hypothetical protein